MRWVARFVKRGSMTKNYDYVIWDFNGTLLDDVQTGILSVNKLLTDRGLKPIESVEHYRKIFRFPIIDYYKLAGFDFDKEPYEILAPQWVKLYLEYVKKAGLFSDVVETLSMLKECGIKQIVLSATEKEMLEGQLSTLGIREYFEEVLGLDNIHAGSKLSLANDWRSRHPNERAILVGDTDHDVQAADTLKAECILIGRGHQSGEYLSKLGVPVYSTLTEAFENLKI